MGLFSNLNHGRKFDFELLEPLPKENYRKLSEVPTDANWIVKSIYRNTKSSYGEHYVILADNNKRGGANQIYGVNLPSFLNETIAQIFASDEMIAAINSGKVAISRSEELKTKAGKIYYTVVWSDLD